MIMRKLDEFIGMNDIVSIHHLGSRIRGDYCSLRDYTAKDLCCNLKACCERRN